MASFTQICSRLIHSLRLLLSRRSSCSVPLPGSLRLLRTEYLLGSVPIFLTAVLFTVFQLSSCTTSDANSESKSAASKDSLSSNAQAAKLQWPPQLNSPYPDLELMSTSGKKVKLSSFKGKVILIEPIGLSCPACQAFVGADAQGGFKGVSPQQGLPSIETLLKRNGISPADANLQRVQLLLYSPSMNAPTLEEAQEWGKHFGFGQAANELILMGEQTYINNDSYNMIPGFQLIDKNFVLRSDATGHHPKNDLYRELLPMIKQLLATTPKE